MRKDIPTPADTDQPTLAVLKPCAGEVKRKRIEYAVADDVIREIYAREGWARHDKGDFATCTARAQSLYEITADPRRNRYVATPIAAAPKAASDTGAGLRERIAAAIVDQDLPTFRLWSVNGTTYPNSYQSSVDQAYAKADRVIAALSADATDGTGS